MSTLLSYCCFCTTSGEAYSGVPQRVSLRSGELTDHPKSQILAMLYLCLSVLRGRECSRASDLCEECHCRACTTLRSKSALSLIWSCPHSVFPIALGQSTDSLNSRAPLAGKGRHLRQRQSRAARYWGGRGSFVSLFLGFFGWRRSGHGWCADSVSSWVRR